MAPRYVRVVTAMPTTATNKIHRVSLRREGFHCDDPVWHRTPAGCYRPLDEAALAALLATYEAQGRSGLLRRPGTPPARNDRPGAGDAGDAEAASGT